MTTLTEDAFLDSQLERSVIVYLQNGIKLANCVLVAHDAEVIFLRSDGTPEGVIQMVSKNAISTIVSTARTENGEPQR